MSNIKESKSYEYTEKNGERNVSQSGIRQENDVNTIRKLSGSIFSSNYDNLRMKRNDPTHSQNEPRSPTKYQSQIKCSTCNQFITDQILCALGKTYHTHCFVCYHCKKCLDGLKFGVDDDEHILCPDDFMRICSPKCALCGQIINPLMETGETVRVVAMGKDFHIDCYKCQDCGAQLTDEADKRCYPLGNILLCYFCHRDRKKPNKINNNINNNNNMNIINNNNTMDITRNYLFGHQDINLLLKDNNGNHL